MERPITFSSAATVVVSPQSRLCPASWAGIVVIGEEATVTVPTAPVAELMRGVTRRIPAASLIRVEILGTVLPIEEQLGPRQ